MGRDLPWNKKSVLSEEHREANLPTSVMAGCLSPRVVEVAQPFRVCSRVQGINSHKINLNLLICFF